MSTKIWLSSPHMGGNELKYIHEAFDENWVAPLGPNVNGFEADLEKFLTERASGVFLSIAALSSGTAALHLALILLGVQAGDEVICQSMTFSASANPIAYQGATPVFVDSEPETWNMCPSSLRLAIADRLRVTGKKPKAIIVVHLYGMPAKMDELVAVAKEFDIPLIEDAAEALGSTYKGQACGTFGRFGILSFNGNKIITTSGGGALVCHNPEDKKSAVFLATQARDEAPHYQHSSIGYNYRMSNICAGIGRGQMEVLADRIAARRAMTEFYVNLFKDNPAVRVLTAPSTDHFSNHWLAAIVIDPEKSGGKTREDLRFALNADNIESRPLWKPMHLQPVFSASPYYGLGGLHSGAVAERLFNDGLCLPSGSNLTEDEKLRITAVINQFFT
jgi:dTDP-4-amino-4,6-dideoxygalactose transaminase